MKTSARSLLFFILLFAFPAMQRTAFSQSIAQGPYNPGFVTEQNVGCLSCPGSYWISPLNATLPDSMYATTQMNAYPNCFMTTCYYARALWANNFGFAIPVNSVVNGIKAEVLRKASAGNAVVDTIVKIIKTTTGAIGNNHALIQQWSTAAQYITYGDSLDLWGTTWTPAEINTADFGFFFKPMNHLPNFITAYVDHIRITVYYTTITGINEQQSSENTLSVFYNHYENVLQIKMNGFNPVEHMLTVYNNMGQQLLKKKLPGNLSENKIPVGKLSAGIYFVEVMEGEKQYTQKLVVQ